MSYVSESLSSGEQIVASATTHWIVFVPGIIITLIGFSFFPILIIGLIIIGLAFLKKVTTELAVTNKKVIGKWGVISRRTIEQRLDKVDSVQIVQGILGRILNYGSVQVNGSGLSATPIPGIADPLTFRRAVERAIDGTK